MSTDVKPSWTSSRLPFLGRWEAMIAAPSLPREGAYLAILPWVITAGLVLLAASGLVLSVYYSTAHPFDSLQFIDRDVNNGWLVHGFHATGASMVFGAAYLMLFRGILARPYKAPAELVWLAQVAVFALLLLVGWLGYTLTGGAASYWALTDAANAASRLGGAPGAIGLWFFGGPNGGGTLARMAVFHIALALVIFGVLWLHRAAKHAVAPSAPVRGAVGFHPYYTSQYFVALVVFALIFSVVLFFAPHFGQSRLNLLPADPSIVPGKLLFPWYLSPVSGLAALLPGTAGGIIAVLAGLGVLFALPWLDLSGPNGRAGFLYRFLVFVLALDVFGLGWAASAPASALSGILMVLFAVWYFLHFLVLTPLVTSMEAE